MRVAIIGAGIIGVSTAYYLKPAHDVTIYESLDAAGLETSFANGGLVTPALSHPWNKPGVFWSVLKMLNKPDTPILFRLSALPALGGWAFRFLRHSSAKRYHKNVIKNVHLGKYSNQLLSEVMRAHHFKCDYQQSGSLVVFRQKEAILGAIELAKITDKLGIPYIHLHGDETMEKEPALLPVQNKIKESLYFPDDAMGDAHQFTQEMAKYLKNIGVEFAYNTDVELVKNQKRVAIKIDEQILEYDCIVLAAGVFSTRLAKTVGIQVPVRPCKGYSITIPAPIGVQFPEIPVLDDLLHAVATPLGNRLRVAGTAEFAGFNKALTENRIENLLRIVHQLYPDIYHKMDQHQIRRWTGLRPMSADGVPIISATKFENLFINTGHGPAGWTMGLGSGKLLADMINHRNTALDMRDYALFR